MTLKSAIELQDKFTPVLFDIVNSVNAAVSVMEEFRGTMNSNVDPAALQTARIQADQAAASVSALGAELGAMPVEKTVRINVSEQTTQVAAKNTNTRSFDTSRQVAEISARLTEMANLQLGITNIAKNMYIVPKETVSDIKYVNGEIVKMLNTIEFLNANPFDIDSSAAQMQVQAISGAIDGLAEKQQSINNFFGNIPSQKVQLEVETNILDSLVEKPVEVPVKWQSDSLKVFTSTGIERFEQEIQSANGMLDSLNQTQVNITREAQVMEILPPNAVTDIQNLQNRISDLRSAVLQAEQNSMNVGSDEANAQLERMRGQFVQLIGFQESLNEAMQCMDVGKINEAYQRLSQNVADVERAVRSSFSVPVEIPFEWQSYNGIDVFTSTGIERFEQELASVNSMLEQLNGYQFTITMESNDTEVLSPHAAFEIRNVESRVQSLIEMIRQVEETSLDIGSDEANANLERLRGSLSETLNLERHLIESMQGTDLSEVNSAFLSLSENISNTEKLVRDTFSEIKVPPIEIPFEWQSDDLDIFTNTGVERFEQEIQSANSLLNSLNQTQSKIAVAAARTELFPSNAIADINGMQSRLQAIQQHIHQIESNPISMGTDKANTELETLREHLYQATQIQQNLNRAIDDMDMKSANEAYQKLSQTVSSMERNIRDNFNVQEQFNQKIRDGTTAAEGLMSTIKKVAAAYLSIQSIGKVANLSDQMTQTTARLNLIVDDGGSAQELQNKIYASAQNTRSSYQSTADAVSKFGLTAGDAFSGTDEIVAFAEQVNKQFAIAGTNAQGIDAAMLQLTQAMGSGVLRGEEFNSILEQAPIMIQSISDYLNVPKGELKEMAAEGMITADIVKNAMFYAADETNNRFESMPMTWEQVWQSMKNTALMAFQHVFEQVNQLANSGGMQTLQQTMTNVFGGLAQIASGVIEIVMMIGEFVMENWSVIETVIDFAVGGLELISFAFLGIMDIAMSVAQGIINNWSIIAPIVYGIITAFLIYKGVLMVMKIKLIMLSST